MVHHPRYGFSDSAEIFISGCGLRLRPGVAGVGVRDRARSHPAASLADLCGTLLLFAFLVAEVSYIAISLGKPFYAEEMAITDFLNQPGIALVQALLLRYRPLNVDVLPLYIVLMAGLPLILLMIRSAANITLAMSVALYALTLRYNLYLTTYPSGFWSFNPFAWQMLLVLSAWCALGGAK